MVTPPHWLPFSGVSYTGLTRGLLWLYSLRIHLNLSSVCRHHRVNPPSFTTGADVVPLRWPHFLVCSWQANLDIHLSSCPLLLPVGPSLFAYIAVFSITILRRIRSNPSYAVFWLYASLLVLLTRLVLFLVVNCISASQSLVSVRTRFFQSRPNLLLHFSPLWEISPPSRIALIVLSAIFNPILMCLLRDTLGSIQSHLPWAWVYSLLQVMPHF